MKTKENELFKQFNQISEKLFTQVQFYKCEPKIFGIDKKLISNILVLKDNREEFFDLQSGMLKINTSAKMCHLVSKEIFPTPLKMFLRKRKSRISISTLKKLGKLCKAFQALFLLSDTYYLNKIIYYE